MYASCHPRLEINEDTIQYNIRLKRVGLKLPTAYIHVCLDSC